MIRSVGHAAKRTRQTVTSFDNGPKVLVDLLRKRITGSPADITLKVKGYDVLAPNVPGARFPVYEALVEDAYRIGWMTSGLSANPVAVDMGGHIGSFALAFAHAHPTGQVVCFEATPGTYAYLQKNIAANGIGDRVVAHNIAVSDHEGELQMASHGDGSGHNGVLHLGEAGLATISVPCVPAVKAFSMAAGPVEVVKMDIEGAEYDMILNSDPADWASVQRVVMEYHDLPGRDWSELRDWFAGIGLSEVARDPAPGGKNLGLAWLSRTPLP
ncbi:FkbM family methyltransferase [Nocardioides sp. AE5]|uniref:FkbM family methyltransferase n=1 Tax=Nocardioides sp. AE5 TaxID=2962573 RepID=UPI002881555F|nr:FkbM family methyltransferase [Nocardioides sp. AE5]MDT0202593.1 FkbM family methyltransferase [Nocardioides sp. AE5]